MRSEPKFTNPHGTGYFDTDGRRADTEAHAFRVNTDVDCTICEQNPTVGDTELCGPCCFGEAETAGGNW